MENIDSITSNASDFLILFNIILGFLPWIIELIYYNNLSNNKVQTQEQTQNQNNNISVNENIIQNNNVNNNNNLNSNNILNIDEILNENNQKTENTQIIFVGKEMKSIFNNYI